MRTDESIEQGVWCPEHGRFHQPRERLVLCLTCSRMTGDVHRVCDRCRAKSK